MNSQTNSSYSITLAQIALAPASNQFIGNAQFTLGDSAGTYFITGVRAVCYILDLGGPEYIFPSLGIVKLNSSVAGSLVDQTMTRRANITLDDFSNDQSSQSAIVMPINTTTIEVGHGLQIRGNQEIMINLFTQYQALIGGGSLIFHLFLNVLSSQDMGSPEPVKGMLNVPARRLPVS